MGTSQKAWRHTIEADALARHARWAESECHTAQLVPAPILIKTLYACFFVYSNGQSQLVRRKEAGSG